jgi:[ribosomal protein S5]-alanine N-acetyltransferase
VAPPVELRPPRADDRLAWCELIRTSRRFFAERVDLLPTSAAFRSYLTASQKPTSAYRLIWRRSDHVLLGAINLSEIVRGKFQSGYLGYYIGARHAGQGYMTEALQLMLRTAFRQLRLHRVEANVQPRNLASSRLVKRAGFCLEGRSRRYLKIGGQWRDHERWALLAEEWRPLPASTVRAITVGQ